MKTEFNLIFKKIIIINRIKINLKLKKKLFYLMMKA